MLFARSETCDTPRDWRRLSLTAPCPRHCRRAAARPPPTIRRYHIVSRATICSSHISLSAAADAAVAERPPQRRFATHGEPRRCAPRRDMIFCRLNLIRLWRERAAAASAMPRMPNAAHDATKDALPAATARQTRIIRDEVDAAKRAPRRSMALFCSRLPSRHTAPQQRCVTPAVAVIKSSDKHARRSRRSRCINRGVPRVARRYSMLSSAGCYQPAQHVPPFDNDTQRCSHAMLIIVRAIRRA